MIQPFWLDGLAVVVSVELDGAARTGGAQLGEYGRGRIGSGREDLGREAACLELRLDVGGVLLHVRDRGRDIGHRQQRHEVTDDLLLVLPR